MPFSCSTLSVEVFSSAVHPFMVAVHGSRFHPFSTRDRSQLVGFSGAESLVLGDIAKNGEDMSSQKQFFNKILCSLRELSTCGKSSSAWSGDCCNTDSNRG